MAFKYPDSSHETFVHLYRDDSFEATNTGPKATQRFLTKDIANCFPGTLDYDGYVPYHGMQLSVVTGGTPTSPTYSAVPYCFCTRIRYKPQWMDKKLGCILECEFDVPRADRAPSGAPDDTFRETWSGGVDAITVDGSEATYNGSNTKALGKSILITFPSILYRVAVTNDLFDLSAFAGCLGKLNNATFPWAGSPSAQTGQAAEFFLLDGAEVQMRKRSDGRTMYEQVYSFKGRPYWNYIIGDGGTWKKPLFNGSPMYGSADFSDLPLYTTTSDS